VEALPHNVLPPMSEAKCSVLTPGAISGAGPFDPGTQNAKSKASLKARDPMKTEALGL
jgi:hypothetical protein